MNVSVAVVNPGSKFFKKDSKPPEFKRLCHANRLDFPDGFQDVFSSAEARKGSRPKQDAPYPGPGTAFADIGKPPCAAIDIAD